MSRVALSLGKNVDYTHYTSSKKYVSLVSHCAMMSPGWQRDVTLPRHNLVSRAALSRGEMLSRVVTPVTSVGTVITIPSDFIEIQA